MIKDIIPFIFILSCLTAVVQCEQKEQQSPTSNLQGEYITSYQIFNDKIAKSSRFLAMVMIAGTSCPNCPKAIQIFEKFAAKMNGYTRNYFLDCSALWLNENERAHVPLCNPSNSSSWPIVQFFKPPESEYDPYDLSSQPDSRQPEVINFKEIISESRLTAFALTHMPLYAKILDTQTSLQKLLEDTQIPNKVILFKKTTEFVPDYFKALTSYFKHKIIVLLHSNQSFIEINDIIKQQMHLPQYYQIVNDLNVLQYFPQFGIIEDEELMKNFEINEIPSVLILKFMRSEKKYKPEIYSGPKRIQGAKLYFQRFAEPNERRDSNSLYKGKSENIETRTVLHFSEISQLLYPDRCSVLFLDSKGNKNVTIEALSMIPGFNEFGMTYKDYIDEIIQYDSRNTNDKEFSDFVRMNNLKIQEDQLLVYPTGKKGINRFMRVTSKQSKKQIELSLIELFDSQEVLLEEGSVRFFIEDVLSSKNTYANIWFLEKPEESSEIILKMKFLANQQRFKDCMRFGLFLNMGEKNKKDWGISNVPEVITFTDLDKKDGNLVTSIYDSNLGFSYLSLSEYLTQLCYDREKKIIESDIVQEVNTEEAFERVCGGDKQCFIAFFDYTNGEKFGIDLRHFKNLSELSRNRTDVHWAQMNGHCHSQILKRLNLDKESLPHLIFYDSSKWRYSAMQKKGQVSFNQMKEFVESMLERKNRKRMKRLSEALDIDEKKSNCSQAPKINEDL